MNNDDIILLFWTEPQQDINLEAEPTPVIRSQSNTYFELHAEDFERLVNYYYAYAALVEPFSWAVSDDIHDEDVCRRHMNINGAATPKSEERLTQLARGEALLNEINHGTYLNDFVRRGILPAGNFLIIGDNRGFEYTVA